MILFCFQIVTASCERSLSKCLKFEVIRGIRLIKGFVFKQKDITRPVRLLSFGEWHTVIILSI